MTTGSARDDRRVPEKAYRFEEIKSGRVLVSRDAQFMEDVFDGGRRSYDEEVIVDLQEEAETTDQETSSEDETIKGTAQRQDFEPGSKRHQRAQSLEEAVEIPQTKRQSRPQTLEEMSAVASGQEEDFEAAYVVDSVGEMPTTFKSAMESSNAAK